MKSKLLIAFALLIISAAPTFGQSGVLGIDSISGQNGADEVLPNTDIIFYIGINNNSGSVMAGITNGFRIYSPDGATWTSTTTDTLGTLGGAQSGLPIGWDNTAYSITIGPIPLDDTNKVICIDSSWYPPSGLWKWAGQPAADWYPDWEGPYCYAVRALGSDVDSRPGDGLPEDWKLSQNYPNPFNPNTQIPFSVKTHAHVSLTVYNVLGQQVATLVDKELAAGNYTADWNGNSDAGSAVASGIYFYRLEAGDFVETKKMTLLK